MYGEDGWRGAHAALSILAFRPDWRALPSALLTVAKTPAQSFAVFTRSCVMAPQKEKIMNPTRIPGNEPDPGDMSTEPGIGAPNDDPDNHDLADDAENLGDFA